MKMMVNYSLLPLLLASPYKNSCSHSNQPLRTRVGQLDPVDRHRWLVAAPPFSLLSSHIPPAHARQRRPSAAPTPTPRQGKNSQMSSTEGKPGLSEQLQKARTTSSSRDRASSNRCMVSTDPCNLFFEFFYKYGKNHAMCTMYREL